MGGAEVITVADEFLGRKRREYTCGAAVREFCEEIFSDRKYPEDFTEQDFQDVRRIMAISDKVNINGREIETVNYMHIGRVNRTDFSLIPREISGFKSLSQLNYDEKLFPLTKLFLVEIHFRIPFQFNEWELFLRPQIEPLLTEEFIADDEGRDSGAAGPRLYYPQAFGMPTNDKIALLMKSELDAIRMR